MKTIYFASFATLSNNKRLSSTNKLYVATLHIVGLLRQNSYRKYTFRREYLGTALKGNICLNGFYAIQEVCLVNKEILSEITRSFK